MSDPLDFFVFVLSISPKKKQPMFVIDGLLFYEGIQRKNNDQSMKIQ